MVPLKDLMCIAQIGFILSSTQSMENLARYIIRASFSQERLNYISEASKVIYKSKLASYIRSLPKTG